MAIRLTLKNLGDIGEGIGKPSYSRSDLSAGILHIGVGNFHRAHQSWYLHELFELGLDHDWELLERVFDLLMWLNVRRSFRRTA